MSCFLTLLLPWFPHRDGHALPSSFPKSLLTGILSQRSKKQLIQVLLDYKYYCLPFVNGEPVYEPGAGGFRIKVQPQDTPISRWLLFSF